MTRFLILSIRFLDGRYHGLTDNGERPEWPPSPFRVFQALVAGNATGGKVPETVREALLWLEALDPPLLCAPRGEAGAEVLTYVLNNLSDTVRNSRTPKTIRPTLLGGDRLVEYTWAFDDSADGAREHAAVVAGAARHVRCLGWGIDLAIGAGEVVDTPPLVTRERTCHRAIAVSSSADSALRVPVAGSLLSLERRHAAFVRRYEEPGITRLEASGAVYRPQAYGMGEPRPNVAFRLVDTEGKVVSVGHQLIAPLVGMIRNLGNLPEVVKILGRAVIDRELMGHGAEGGCDRVSILTLPTLGDGPTDGRIRRFLLAQPAGSEGRLCARMGRLFDGQELHPVGGESRFHQRMFLERIEVSDRDQVTARYVGSGHQWASVTPVLLPGYDDRKAHRGDHVKRLARAEQLLKKALLQARVSGLLKEAELTRVPYFSGSLHASQYSVRQKLAHYPRYHVRLQFVEPVTGPLAIGAGRHCGFGILATCD